MSAKKPEVPPLPPEGLWISPSGEIINVTEHLEAIRNRPQAFGLLKSDVRSNDIRHLRNIGVTLIRAGWVRFRTLDLTFHFEVDSVGARRKIIADVLDSTSTCPDVEQVIITELQRRVIVAGSVTEFRQDRLYSREEKDLLQHRQWAFSPPRPQT
jgi:hypothetical protein